MKQQPALSWYISVTASSSAIHQGTISLCPCVRTVILAQKEAAAQQFQQGNYSSALTGYQHCLDHFPCFAQDRHLAAILASNSAECCLRVASSQTEQGKSATVNNPCPAAGLARSIHGWIDESLEKLVDADTHLERALCLLPGHEKSEFRRERAHEPAAANQGGDPGTGP